MTSAHGSRKTSIRSSSNAHQHKHPRDKRIPLPPPPRHLHPRLFPRSHRPNLRFTLHTTQLQLLATSLGSIYPTTDTTYTTNHNHVLDAKAIHSACQEQRQLSHHRSSHGEGARDQRLQSRYLAAVCSAHQLRLVFERELG